MHLINFSELSQKKINDIFEIADCLKKEPQNYKRILNGKNFVLFFPESSIRTRITFEKAIQALGATSILFPPSTLDKKEAMCDVTGYIKNWADGIVVRHADHSKVASMAKLSEIPVINAMTSENHPCEILSDLYTLKEMNENYSHQTYTFIGECGNIARTWVEAAEVLKLKFNHVFFESECIKEQNDPYYTFSTKLDGIIKQSDVVLTDPVPEASRTPEYLNLYQLTLDHMHKAPKGARLNPCPPFFRGAEVTAEVIDSPYFVGYGFKSNLLVVQQAVLLYCMGLYEQVISANN